MAGHGVPIAPAEHDMAVQLSLVLLVVDSDATHERGDLELLANGVVAVLFGRGVPEGDRRLANAADRAEVSGEPLGIRKLEQRATNAVAVAEHDHESPSLAATADLFFLHGVRTRQ